MVVAALLGTGPAADAFIVAFRIPNLLRRLFAEGALTSSFIPVFSDYLTSKTREESFDLARIVLTFLSLILSIVTLLGIIFSPLIVRLLAPGFHVEEMRYDLAVLLTRITFPYVLLISFVAVFMGILNSLKSFAAPAAAPIFLNVGIIGAAFFISPYLDEPVVGLAVGILIGGVLQIAIQIPWVLREGIQLLPKWNPVHAGVIKIGLQTFPAIFGSAIYQFNHFIGTILGSTLAVGSVSWLYFADRLVQFPFGVFAIAISTASLPTMSIQASKMDLGEFRKTLSYSLRLTFFIALPSMAGLMILGKPIIRILFERGVFDSYSTVMTLKALIYYSVGLWAFSASAVISAAFFAFQDMKTPMRIAFISLIAHLALSLVLMGPLKHGGLALALSSSSIIQLIFLVYFMSRKIGKQFIPEVMFSALRSLLATGIMSIIVYLIYSNLLVMDRNSGVPSLIVQLAGLIFIGMGCFVISARLFGCRELKEIKDLMIREVGHIG
jgi:putative peptidoglycan lipid II flippase